MQSDPSGLDGDVPFTDVLAEQVVAQALTAVSDWLDQAFSPPATPPVSLGQVPSAAP